MSDRLEDDGSGPAPAIGQILRAAYVEFGQNGLENTTMELVAKRAGLSKQLVYYYFGNKQGLYIETLKDLIHRSHAPIFAFDFDSLQPLPAIQKLFELSYDANLHNFGAFAIDQMLNPKALRIDRGLTQNYGRRVTDVIGGILDRGRRDRSIRPDVDAEMVHGFLWVLNVGFLSSRKLLGEYMMTDFDNQERKMEWRRLASQAIVALLAVDDAAARPGLTL